jgi:hypothetical protein
MHARPLFAGEFDFLHEHPGGFSAPVTVSNVPQKKLSKAHADAFKRNLERLRDLLGAQPVFKPPLGIEIIGYFRPNDQFPAAQNLVQGEEDVPGIWSI